MNWVLNGRRGHEATTSPLKIPHTPPPQSPPSNATRWITVRAGLSLPSLEVWVMKTLPPLTALLSTPKGLGRERKGNIF